MKENLEKLKDILYDFSDYLIIGGIILSIVIIIGWRLDILFPETIAMVGSENLSTVEKEIKKPEIENKDSSGKAQEDSKDIQEKSPDIIKVSIPKGTPSTNIGKILVDLDLVESVDAFEKKVYDLKLEKKLRSGEFDISKDDSLETIVKIIANENR